MLKKTLRLGVALFSLLAALPVHGQEVATLALRNGERPSGELLDMNAGGLWLRINGQDRAFPAAQVAAVEFVVGPVSREAQVKIDSGQPFLMLRSGQLVDGRLSDIGGTHPLRVTLETPGGTREFPSNEVAQIYVNPAAKSTSADGVPRASQRPDAAAAGAITVPANIVWTETGLTVNAGQRFQFNATGDIMLSAGASSGPGGSPAATAPNVRYPVAGAPAGALIGRVGNGDPFLIGANTQPMPMRGRGRLMLGVNDDHVPDNSGTFQVTVTRAN